MPHFVPGLTPYYRTYCFGLKVKLLKEQIARIPALNSPRLNIKVATVDGFQGSECDIIILSCVRSHSQAMRGKIQHQMTAVILHKPLVLRFLHATIRWSTREQYGWISE